MPKSSIELSASLFAVVISGVALGLSWWQLEISREHNRISVQPVIAITPYLEGPSGRNGVFLANQGLGPAKLTSFNVTVNGQTFEGLGRNQWPEVIRKAGSEPSCFKHGWPVYSSVLKAGEEEVLLAPSLANLPGCKAIAILFQLQKDVNIEIGYESFYGEAFETNGSVRMNLDFP